MRYMKLGILVAAVTLLLLGGCRPRAIESGGKWVDVSEISANVNRKEAAPTVLEKDAAGVKKGPEGPAKKEIAPPAEGERNDRLAPFSPKPRQVPQELAGEGVLLNFDNADIYEVIQSISEILDLNYIIDPSVKGVVNIRSGKKIPMDQLFAVFQKMLHINGLDIKSEGAYDYIYVARQQAGLIRGPEQLGALKESPLMVLQIIPISHLASAEAMKLVEPYLSEQGKVFDMPSQNYLIITDYESKILDCVTILSHLDVSPLASLQVTLIRIENAPLFDVKDELEEIMKAMNVEKKDFQGVSVTPLERINSLLLVSSNTYLLTTVEGWVRDLDVQPTQGRDNIYIYNVRNSVASELEELVTSLISEKGDSKKSSSSEPAPMPDQKTTDKDKDKKTTTTTPPKTKKKSKTKTAAGVTAPSPAMQFTGEPMLISDDSRNIILIRALQPDYLRLQKLLERLDNIPRQVLIEMMVAEIQLTDEWQMGIEWWAKNQSMHPGGDGKEINQNFSSLFSGKIKDRDFSKIAPAGPGFAYNLLSNNENLYALLSMLATDNNLSVLSSPQVLVLNNETATVNVGDQVPIVTSQTSDTSSGTTSNQTVQYKDTGIILNVTPRINDDGIILIDVDQQVSGVKDKTGISPTISTKQVKTKLAVKDGQSILIGGLISRDQESTDSGVPFIKDIPVLGNFFKYQSETDSKKELLIMITPHVIESENVLDQYTREFSNKVNELRRDLTQVAKDSGKKKENEPAAAPAAGAK